MIPTLEQIQRLINKSLTAIYTEDSDTIRLTGYGTKKCPLKAEYIGGEISNPDSPDIDYPVTTVFGREGDITAQTGDYSISQITGNETLVYNNLEYANPDWITELAWSKITGAPDFITLDDLPDPITPNVYQADSGVWLDDDTFKLGGNALTANTTIDAATFWLRIIGRFQESYGATVVSANSVTLGNGNTFNVSGNTELRAITTANWNIGSVVRLVFGGTPTVKHNTAGGAGTAPILLAGEVDLVVQSNDVLTLVYDGTVWHETSRKLAATNGVYSVSNGLRPDPTANNFKLGGTGIENTIIAWDGYTFTNTFNGQTNNGGLILSSTSTASTGGSALLKISATGILSTASSTTYGAFIQNIRTGTGLTTTGIYSEGTTLGANLRGGSGGLGALGFASGSGNGLQGQSGGSGIGVWAISVSGRGLEATSQTGIPLVASIAAKSANNSTGQFGLFSVSAAGVGAAGLGGYISHMVEHDNATTANGTFEAVRTEWSVVDAAQATYSGKYSIYTMTGGLGTLTKKFEILPTGQIVNPIYGDGTFTGTLTYVAGWDVDGNLIEVDPGDLGGGGSNTFGNGLGDINGDPSEIGIIGGNIDLSISGGAGAITINSDNSADVYGFLDLNGDGTLAAAYGYYDTGDVRDVQVVAGGYNDAPISGSIYKERAILEAVDFQNHLSHAISVAPDRILIGEHGVFNETDATNPIKIFLYGLQDAANDAAAAALSPAVEVNQLYRNGSVLMVRVS